MLKRHGWTREDDALLRRLYPNLSDSDVARQMQRTLWSIQSRARRLRLTKNADYRTALNQAQAERLRQRNLTYHLNHHYFSRIISREQAYWLGWLWSDGCVRKQGNSCEIILSLQKSDESVLHRFRSAVSADYPIRVDREAVTLCLISSQMFADLERHGVIPHKSTLATSPNIGREFTSDFVRGVFDGDGCITTGMRKAVTIIGTEPFCCWLQATTQREIGIRSAVYHKKNTAFRWVVGAGEMITSFARWMYRANADGSLPVHLERKYARFVSAGLI
jgi:hypothetical protein